MDYPKFKEAVARHCARQGIGDFELYYQNTESVSVSVYCREINQFSASLEGGVCLRCVWQGKIGSASTEALTEEEASALVERAVDNASVLEAEEPVLLCEGGKVYARPEVPEGEYPSTQTLIRTALNTQEQLYSADPAVVDGCTTQTLAEREEIALFNSRGLDRYSRTTVTGVAVTAVVSNGTDKANDFQMALKPLEAVDTAALTEKAARNALTKLGGEPAPTGKYPVIFSPEAMQSLLSTFCPVFSGENVRKNLSRLGGLEGKLIASPAVTLVDDPMRPGSWLQRSFDAEGSPTFRKAIIERGTLNTLLYDLKNAALMGKETTGNAAKSGYSAPIGIRPFNLWLEAGDCTRQELVEMAENGVYIHFLGGLHAGANTVSGDFSLQSAGFRIEKGQLTAYVKSFTVAGNFYDLLKNIRALASDLEFPGMGTVGSPSVLVDGLTIAGKD